MAPKTYTHCQSQLYMDISPRTSHLASTQRGLSGTSPPPRIHCKTSLGRQRRHHFLKWNVWASVRSLQALGPLHYTCCPSQTVVGVLSETIGALTSSPSRIITRCQISRTLQIVLVVRVSSPNWTCLNYTFMCLYTQPTYLRPQP